MQDQTNNIVQSFALVQRHVPGVMRYDKQNMNKGRPGICDEEMHLSRRYPLSPNLETTKTQTIEWLSRWLSTTGR
jgi:hypothetical protein